MQSRTKWFTSLIAAVALAVGIGSIAVPAGAEELPVIFAQCGDVITQSAKLGNNVTGCQTKVGLTIQGEDITLDLGSRTVSGIHQEDTVGILAAHGAKIRNGIVRDWGHGVQFQSVTGGSAKDLLVMTNETTGIVIDSDSSGITLRDNRVIGNHGRGVSITAATDITLLDNKMKSNDGMGLHLDDVSESRIEGNTLAANYQAGVFAVAATQNVFVGNTFESNWKGIHLFPGSTGNTIESNEFLGNFTGIEFTAAHANVFRFNSVRKSTGEGVLVNGLSENNVLSKNIVNGSAWDGMVIDNPTTVVKSNTANNNGFTGGVDDDISLGIDAEFGALGSGNTATGNDDPAQCNPQSLCS